MYSERGVQIGYLTAERAPRIGQLIRAGHEVTSIFQEATRYGAVIRVAFGGERPALPMSDSVFEPEPDWLPDDEWPD